MIDWTVVGRIVYQLQIDGIADSRTKAQALHSERIAVGAFGPTLLISVSVCVPSVSRGPAIH